MKQQNLDLHPPFENLPLNNSLDSKSFLIHFYIWLLWDLIWWLSLIIGVWISIYLFPGSNDKFLNNKQNVKRLNLKFLFALESWWLLSAISFF